MSKRQRRESCIYAERRTVLKAAWSFAQDGAEGGLETEQRDASKAEQWTVSRAKLRIE